MTSELSFRISFFSNRAAPHVVLPHDCFLNGLGNLHCKRVCIFCSHPQFTERSAKGFGYQCVSCRTIWEGAEALVGSRERDAPPGPLLRPRERHAFLLFSWQWSQQPRIGLLEMCGGVQRVLFFFLISILFVFPSSFFGVMSSLFSSLSSTVLAFYVFFPFFVSLFWIFVLLFSFNGFPYLIPEFLCHFISRISVWTVQHMCRVFFYFNILLFTEMAAWRWVYFLVVRSEGICLFSCEICLLSILRVGAA
jgi:hypothetical protein